MKNVTLVVVVLTAAMLAVTLTACGGGGGNPAGGNPAGGDAPYRSIGSWNIPDSGVTGYPLTATTQFVFCGATNPARILHYWHDGTFSRYLDPFFKSPALGGPLALSFTGGWVYVADGPNGFRRKYPANDLDASSFKTRTGYSAYGIASTDSHHFLLWMSGTASDILQKVTTTGSSVTETTAEVEGGQALAVDSAGDLYLCNIVKDEIQKYSGSTLAPGIAFGSDRLSSPFDIAIANDTVYVINDLSEIAVYDTQGNYQGSFGSFVGAEGIAAYGDKVWVAEWNWMSGTGTMHCFQKD